jgi:hypothetical protein
MIAKGFVPEKGVEAFAIMESAAGTARRRARTQTACWSGRASGMPTSHVLAGEGVTARTAGLWAMLGVADKAPVPATGPAAWRAAAACELPGALSAYVVVNALVRDESGTGLVVVRQAALGDLAPRWTVPGGKVEPAETIHSALARELREETGLA